MSQLPLRQWCVVANPRFTRSQNLKVHGVDMSGKRNKTGVHVHDACNASITLVDLGSLTHCYCGTLAGLARWRLAMARDLFRQGHRLSRDGCTLITDLEF
jgi:hypothetical protein